MQTAKIPSVMFFYHFSAELSTSKLSTPISVNLGSFNVGFDVSQSGHFLLSIGYSLPHFGHFTKVLSISVHAGYIPSARRFN